MEVVAPTGDAVAVLRAIGRAGFGYQQTKKVALAAGWKLVDDEFDLGYVAVEMLLPGQDMHRRLVVLVSESNPQPRAFVPLFYYEDYDIQREPLDEAYRLLREQLSRVIDRPTASGQFNYSHREDWGYFYCYWSLSDITFVLTQDEFDIQFGMDVTLWMLPAGIAVQVPVKGA